MRRPPVTSRALFKDAALVNDATYFDYLERLKKVALSLFEWVGLPDGMDSRWLERCLYYKGCAAMLYDEKMGGFINTSATAAGQINIYGIPTSINCYSYGYQSTRKAYTHGSMLSQKPEQGCVLVMNNWERLPTASSIELFAMRLYEAERATDVNIKNSKFPLVILTDDKQRLTMVNMYHQISGNEPAIFGDKNSGIQDSIQVLKTDSPYLADKLMDYKKQIWNEALLFLGINTIDFEKKERLVAAETSSNNEVTNLNLQSYLAPRKEACKLFNEKFGLTGTDKEIDVRVRSDLFNVVKEQESTVSEYVTTDLGEGADYDA